MLTLVFLLVAAVATLGLCSLASEMDYDHTCSVLDSDNVRMHNFYRIELALRLHTGTGP